MFESLTYNSVIHSFLDFHYISFTVCGAGSCGSTSLKSKTIPPSRNVTAAGVVPAAAVAKMKEDGPQRLFSEVLRSLGHVWSKDWCFDMFLFLCDDTVDALQRFTELHRVTEFIQRPLLIHTFSLSIFGCCFSTLLVDTSGHAGDLLEWWITITYLRAPAL